MAVLVDYDRARRLLDKYKIRSVRSAYISSAQEAVSFARGDDPIVLKLLSQKALHKSRNGLVALGLRTDKEITGAYNRLKAKGAKLKPYKILAQRMVGGGTEIIIGGNVDQQFGKMVLLGLGGVYVETFKDFALRLCPITRYDALSMINQLRSRHVIAPDKKSQEMIVGLLLRVSRLFSNGKFSELDLNPIILHDGTYDAVDLRILE